MNKYPIYNYCTQIQKNGDYQFTCTRYIISFIGSILIILISSYFCFKTYRNANKFVYELLPMLICILQGVIHVIQFSILNENHLTLLANLAQIVIFSLVGYTFSLVFKKISTDDSIIQNQFDSQIYNFLQEKTLTQGNNLHNNLYFIDNLYFPNKNKCLQYVKIEIINSFFYIVIILTIVDVLITMSIIVYYGRKLKKVLVYARNRFSSNKNDISQQFVHPNIEADLPKEKIRQIQVVVFSIAINTILYIIIIIILFWSDRDLLCDFEKDDILDVKNNILILIFTTTQLFPCFIVPYAFNYRLKENTFNDDGLEFTRERAASSKFQIEENNDQFVLGIKQLSIFFK